MRVIQEITNEKISRRIDEFEARMRRERKETKMLNFDKYREKIMNHPEGPLGGVMSVYFGDIRTAYAEDKNVIKWLLSEYEPPLLKNGDGLKPGDLIMVRDREGDEWRKRQFAYYFDGAFFCAAHGCKLSSCEINRWLQARLPEEGE